MSTSELDPPSAEEGTRAPHLILVADAEGTVLHSSGAIDELLGGRPPSNISELASLFSNESGRELPRPGEEATAAVRRVADGRRLLMSTHPLRLPQVGDQAAEITVFALSAQAAVVRHRAIDTGIAAVLSHELRTPITTIYAGSQMLLAARRLSPESQREMLSDIQVEADRLYRLVEDLLVANVGQEGIQIVAEPILLQRTLPRVVAAEAIRWPHVGFVTTVASELPAVRADELYVEHVVRDLLANAGSFSEPQGTVRLDARRGPGSVEVRVLDEGPGIPPDVVATLFQPFRGGTPDGVGRPGPGLGLYVCKLLVEAMGGRIWARPRPSGGSEFGFSLQPYGDEADEAAQDSGRRRATG